MLTLYTKAECPFCWKVRMALALKSLSYQAIEVDTHNKPAELLALSAKGTVPVLVVDNEVLDESAAIVAYLDRHVEMPPLLTAPAAQALQNYSDKNIGPQIRDAIFIRREQPEAEWDHAVLSQCQCAWEHILEHLEGQCSPSGPWFLGDTPSIADCALCARFALAQYYGLHGVDKYPKLLAWITRLYQSNAFRQACPAHIYDALLA